MFAAPPKSAPSKKKTGDGFTPTKADPKAAATSQKSDADGDENADKKVVKTDKDWLKILTREQFRVTRKGGAERPFQGKMWNNNKDGIYVCLCCGRPLFDSTEKFDAKNGYPCFNEPIDEKVITIASDKKKIECSRCDANLGQLLASNGSQTGGGLPAAGGALPGTNLPPAGLSRGRHQPARPCHRRVFHPRLVGVSQAHFRQRAAQFLPPPALRPGQELASLVQFLLPAPRSSRRWRRSTSRCDSPRPGQ